MSYTNSVLAKRQQTLRAYGVSSSVAVLASTVCNLADFHPLRALATAFVVLYFSTLKVEGTNPKPFSYKTILGAFWGACGAYLAMTAPTEWRNHLMLGACWFWLAFLLTQIQRRYPEGRLGNSPAQLP